MSRSTPELLREALLHLKLASQYAGVGELDQLVIDAICMRLSAGIEVLARLDPDARSRLFGDNWQIMWGMRNRIAHGYLMVDSDIVHQTIEIDLPDIVRVIALELLGSDDGDREPKDPGAGRTERSPDRECPAPAAMGGRVRLEFDRQNASR